MQRRGHMSCAAPDVAAAATPFVVPIGIVVSRYPATSVVGSGAMGVLQRNPPGPKGLPTLQASHPSWDLIGGLSGWPPVRLEEFWRLYNQDFDLIFARDTDPIDLFCQQHNEQVQRALLRELKSFYDGVLREELGPRPREDGAGVRSK